MQGITDDLVAGVFKTREQAEAAIGGLLGLGLADDALGLVVPEPGRYPLEDHEAEEIGRGIARGVAIGGPIGGLAGLTLAAVVVPGVGVLGLGGLAFRLVEGGLWGAFAGSFGGLVARVVAGADDERWCEIPVGSSEILVVARAGAQVGEAHQVMQRHGARCFLTGLRFVSQAVEGPTVAEGLASSAI